MEFIKPLSGLVLVFIGLVLYFIPSLVANKRKHKNAASILVTNLFFGWTFIGWVICLIWSVSSHVEEKHEMEMAGKS